MYGESYDSRDPPQIRRNMSLKTRSKSLVGKLSYTEEYLPMTDDGNTNMRSKQGLCRK